MIAPADQKRLERERIGPHTKVELTVYVPAEIRTQLRLEAARTGRPMSELVTDMIRTALHRRDVDQHNQKKKSRRRNGRSKEHGRRK